MDEFAKKVLREALHARNEFDLKGIGKTRTFYVSKKFIRELSNDPEETGDGSLLFGVKMCVIKNVEPDYFDYSIDWGLDKAVLCA